MKRLKQYKKLIDYAGSKGNKALIYSVLDAYHRDYVKRKKLGNFLMVSYPL